jgi:hypothetical protein
MVSKNYLRHTRRLIATAIATAPEIEITSIAQSGNTQT